MTGTAGTMTRAAGRGDLINLRDHALPFTDEFPSALAALLESGDPGWSGADAATPLCDDDLRPTGENAGEEEEEAADDDFVDDDDEDADEEFEEDEDAEDADEEDEEEGDEFEEDEDEFFDEDEDGEEFEEGADDEDEDDEY